MATSSHLSEIGHATVRLVCAGPTERPILANLLQLYYYDFSEFTDDSDSVVDDHGLFPAYPELDSYLATADRHAYLVRQDHRVQGFVFVRKLERNFDEPTWGMQEFFILRHERRRGMGRQAAMAAFAKHPGRWEVGVLHANSVALAFWRNVITDVTHGRWSVEGADDPTSPGPLFIFRVPA